MNPQEPLAPPSTEERAGRVAGAIYDVTVANQEDAVIAVMRGNAREVGGTHFEEE